MFKQKILLLLRFSEPSCHNVHNQAQTGCLHFKIESETESDLNDLEFKRTGEYSNHLSQGYIFQSTSAPKRYIYKAYKSGGKRWVVSFKWMNLEKIF